MKRYVAGGLFFAIGLAMFIITTGILWRDQAATDWPTVQGTVTGKSIDAKRNRRRKRGTKTTYAAIVDYDYTVEGQDYSVDSVYIISVSGSRQSAQNVIDDYQIGKEVAVHYDPQSHGAAVLRPGELSWFFYLLPLMGLVFAGVGTMVLVGAIRR